jgi:DNA-binding beta-propeller fold protein YncE
MSTQTFLKYLACFVLVLTLLSVAQDAGPAKYEVADTIKVGGEGGWDYASLSEDGKLLFLPRTSHAMVVDTASGKVVGDFGKIGKGHGIAVAPTAGRGFLTDGKNGTVVVFDLKTFDVLGTIPAADDADGIIYDAASDSVLVSCGDAGVMLAIPANVDPKNGKPPATIELGGKPEFLATDVSGKAFVNLADKDMVAEIDTKAMKLVTKWSTGPGKDPTGLSIDTKNGRLYVGCRNQKMIVMSTKDGAVLADLPIGRGVDGTAFANGTAFASCTDGTLTIIRETSASKFEVVQTVKTAPGAKTMAVDSNASHIYLPTADMEPAVGKARPTPVAGRFKVLVV